MSTFERILQGKIIVIVRNLPLKHMLDLANALHAGQIDMIEVTFNQTAPETWADTAASIRALAAHTDILPGAGTVMNETQYHLARDAGAQYIVTPCVDPALIGKIMADGLCALPGALTPTEISLAHQAGAEAVKVFPAGNLGPGYIKAISAPLSNIPLLAVGGVNVDNCADFIAAGCVGIGVGGSLVNKQWIANGEYDKVTALAKEFVRNVSQ